MTQHLESERIGSRTEGWASSHPGSLGMIVIAAFVVICAGVKAAQAILTPVLLGAYLAIVATPLVRWLQKHRFPLVLAASIALLADTVVLVGFLGLLVVSTSELYNDAPNYVGLFQERAGSLAEWLGRHGVIYAASDLFDPRATVGVVASLLGNLADIIWTVGIASIVVFFLLLRFAGLEASPRSGRFLGSERMTRTIREVNRYIAIKTATSMATGLLVGCWIWLLDGDLAVLFGMLAFLLNYIPNVGSLVAAVPAIALGYLSGGAGHAALLTLGYTTINIGIGNFLEPRIMGRALGLWPLVALVSVFFWGWLLGATGALLSALLTVVVKMVLLTLNDLRPIGLMLGPIPKTPNHPATDEAILEGTLPQTTSDG